MGEEKVKTELKLNQGQLRAICGAMPKTAAVRFYLNGFLLDVHPDGERLIAVAVDGHVLAMGVVSEPSVERVADFVHFRDARAEMLTAREDNLEAEMLAKGDSYRRAEVHANIIVCPDGLKLPPNSKNGASCTLTLDTEGPGVATWANRSMSAITLSDGKFPDWPRVCPWDLWAEGAPGTDWKLGANMAFNVGLLHRIFPDGWAVYHRPEETTGVMFARPICGDLSIQVALMGMRI